MAFTMLSEEDVLKNVGMSALIEKLVPKACKEACKNSDANVKIHALFFLSLVCIRWQTLSTACINPVNYSLDIPSQHPTLTYPLSTQY